MRTIVRSAVALLFLATAGCDRPAFMTDLALSADRLEFVAPPGSGDPPGQVLYVTNPGEGRLARPEVTIAYTGAAAGWLAVTVSEDADAPYRLDVTAAAGGLAPGSYTATLTVASANAPGSPAQLPVTLAVPGPSYAVDREALEFVAARGTGQDPVAQAVAVANGGRGILPVPGPSITYVGRQGWLTVEVGGTPSGYLLTVRAAVAGVPSGSYAATIALSGDGVTGPARTIGVSLTVPPPEIAFEYAYAAILGPPYGADPDPTYVWVRNGGGGQLAAPMAVVTVDDPAGPTWISVSPVPGGAAPPYGFALQARQVGMGLSPGIHTATLFVASEGATPARLPIMFSVPETGIGAEGVSFGLARDCPMLPEPQRVRLWKTGPAPVPRPTPTVLGAASTWLEAAVRGNKEPWTLQVQLKQYPPAGETQARVRIEAAGVLPAEVTIGAYPLTAPPDTRADSPPLALWAQVGLGDPGPAAVRVSSTMACQPPPTVNVSYPDGTPPWLTISSRQGYLFQDLMVQPSAAGMVAGETRSGTLTFDTTANGFTFHEQRTVTLGAGVLRAGPTLATPRVGHALTVTGFGSVLVSGGRDAAGTDVESLLEGFGTWRTVPAGTFARPWAGHAALPYDGKLLLVGGPTSEFAVWTGGSELTRGHLRNPSPTPTVVPVSTPWSASRYLVLGGQGNPEIVDVERGTAVEVAAVPAFSAFTSAVVLPDGRVLVAGHGLAGPVKLAALYDPSTDEWSDTGAPNELEGDLVLEALPDGRVLALGRGLYWPAAELWDPVTGRWTTTSPPRALHARGETVTLTNGRVLAFGGWVVEEGAAADVEMFDPASESWTVVGALPSPRREVKVVRLPSGEILGVGGVLADGSPTTETFLW